MANILLVDDDALIIKLYQVILRAAEFDVEIAMSGAEMWKSVENKKPDVILLDVVLPDCNGLDLCKKIKEHPLYLNTKIILVSGEEVSPVQIAQGIDLGADDYLVKPFHPKELLARVKNCLKLKTVEEALRDKNQELKDLSNYLQNIREEERKYVAREVQEELGQLTAALKMDVDWLIVNLPDTAAAQKERLVNASEITKLIIQHIRRLASSLRPSMLDELGLFASLEWKSKTTTTQDGIPCRFLKEGNDEDLPIQLKTVVFRVCQEAIMNCVQHAKATSILVEAKVSENWVQVTIQDNGIGFEPVKVKRQFGLIGMRERAHSLNGELLIESSTESGTQILLTIPKHP